MHTPGDAAWRDVGLLKALLIVGDQNHEFFSTTLRAKQAVREAATICPWSGPCKLTFDPLTLKVVSESCVTWATSVPILV